MGRLSGALHHRERRHHRAHECRRGILEEMTGLNLGCGTRIFKGTTDMQWTNLDIQPGLGVNLVHDWRDLSTIYEWKAPGDIIPKEFDIIVAHQTFEHVNCGMQPIKQCYEVLKKGGSLVVSVPDLRK